MGGKLEWYESSHITMEDKTEAENPDDSRATNVENRPNIQLQPPAAHNRIHALRRHFSVAHRQPICDLGQQTRSE